MLEAEDRRCRLKGFLEVILEDHGEKWFKFLLRVLGSREDAEDAMQEGVRRVLGCDRSFPAENEARMYLARSISNTAFEIYKYRKRQRARQIPVTGNLLVAGRTGDPHSCMEEMEVEGEREHLLSVLGEALISLPAREYQALHITVLEPRGGSIRDAGLAHGIPYSTLRHRRVKGLRRLRRQLSRALRRSGLKFLLA